MVRNKVFCLAVTLVALGAVRFAPKARAAVYAWANAGSDWATAANWGGTAPGSGDTGLFNLGSYTFQPNVSASTAVGGIWDTGAGAVTIDGASLTLHAALINGNYATGIEMDPGAGPLTITAPVALGASQVWLNNATTLSVQGNVVLNGYALTVSGSGNTSIGGAISGAGPNGLNMIGTGTLQLSGPNTFSGQTIIDGGTLQLTAGSLASLTQYVGYNFNGAFAQTGGTNAGTALYVAFSPGSSGAYGLSGGMLTTPIQEVGWSAGGSFTQSGGTNSFSNVLQLGYGTGGAGSYNATNGLVSGYEIDIGVSGSGSFTQSGGVVAAAAPSDAVNLGVGGGSGSYNLTGGSLAAADEEVGYASYGVFTQTGGTNMFLTATGGTITGGFLNLGWAGSGTYNLAGGQLLGYETNVGLFGAGSLSQSGGVSLAENALVLGFYAGGSGTYSLSGGTLVSPFQILGYGGNGAFTQTGGTTTYVQDMQLGGGTGTVGIYNMAGGQSIGYEIDVGVSGSGVVNHTGGTVSLANALVVGGNPGAGGTYTLSGSGYLNAPVDLVGYGGSGSFTQSGGTNVVGSGLVLASGPASIGTYNMNGGLLLLAGGLYSGSGSFQFNFSGGTIAAAGFWGTSVPITLPTGGSSGTINTEGNEVYLAGPITGPGGLVLADSGGGVLFLATSDGYSGGTRITSGSLQIGDPAALGTGALAVDGGTLDMSGLNVQVSRLSGIAGTITNSGGTVATLIVSQTGTSTFSGSLQDGASPVGLEMAGGKLVLSGSDMYSGGTTVLSGTLVIAHDYSIEDGTSLMVGNPALFGTAVASAVVPSAAATRLPPLSETAAPELDARRLFIPGAGQLPRLATAVPEPGTLLLLAAGAGLVAVLRNRRAKTNAAESCLARGSV